MTASGWTFGWEALVAVGTILLALATTWLGLATRRMATYTAQEVQANRRPMLLPGIDAVERSSIVVTEHVGPPGRIYSLRFPIRNAGAGPALDVAFATHTEWPFSNPVSIAVGDEVFFDFPTFRRPDEGQTVDDGLSFAIYIDYEDVGGAPFSTTLNFYFRDDPPASIQVLTDIAEGRVTKPFVLPPMKPASWNYRRTPLRPRLQKAWQLLLMPGDPMRPLRPRLVEAWREIFPERKQSYAQRFRYARWADRMEHDFWSTTQGRWRRLRLRFRIMRGTFRKYR